MKPLLLPALVLGGFITLCALGFWLGTSHPTESPPETSEAPRPSRAPAPARPSPRVRAVRGPPAPDAGKTRARRPEPKPVEIPTFPLPPAPTARAALAPMVNVCFEENADLKLGPPRATLRFTPTADGHLARGRVLSVSDESPWVRACLEEVMEDARFAPGGTAPGKPVRVRFRYTTDGGTSAVLR